MDFVLKFVGVRERRRNAIRVRGQGHPQHHVEPLITINN